jgi:hypothetical protein
MYLGMQVGTQRCFIGQLNNYDGMPSELISTSKLIYFIKFLDRPDDPK